jgi:hypothetical protein
VGERQSGARLTKHASERDRIASGGASVDADQDVAEPARAHRTAVGRSCVRPGHKGASCARGGVPAHTTVLSPQPKMGLSTHSGATGEWQAVFTVNAATRELESTSAIDSQVSTSPDGWRWSASWSAPTTAPEKNLRGGSRTIPTGS